MSESNMSPFEELTMLSIGAAVVASLLTVATWHKVVAYLVDQQVLVAASESPLVSVPASKGAGLDAPRLAVVAAIALFGVVLLVSAARRRSEEEQERR